MLTYILEDYYITMLPLHEKVKFNSWGRGWEMLKQFWSLALVMNTKH